MDKSLKNYEFKKSLIEKFQKLISGEYSQEDFVNDLKYALKNQELLEGYNTIKQKYLSDTLLDLEEGFKPAECIGTWRTSYYYYISNLGRALVVDIKSVEDFHNNNKKTVLTFKNSDRGNKCLSVGKNCWFITIDDGRFKEIIDFPYDYLSVSSTDIYKYVIDARWLDNELDNKSYKLSEQWLKKRNIHNKQIDIHHINNEPSDNGEYNLIYIPKVLHDFIPKR